MIRISAVLLTAFALSIAGCTDPEMEQRVAQLEQRTADLDTKVAALEKRPAAAPGQAKRPTVDPEKEKAAGVLLREASKANEALEYEKAKTMLAELQEKYPETRSARQSKRLSLDLEMIGKDAGELEVESWFQGNTSMGDGEATLVVFWEVWCPHCRREVPNVQKTYEKYKDQGLNLVAVTKITKTATNEKVQEFIDENSLTYPMAKENGKLSERFGVRGIPAAAVVKDGKIVWRGHPAKLNDGMLEGWIKG